jgi:hypothetical protein
LYHPSVHKKAVLTEKNSPQNDSCDVKSYDPGEEKNCGGGEGMPAGLK